MEPRKQKINEVLKLVKGNLQGKQMNIFVKQPQKNGEAVFYKSIPWDSNCNVNVPDESSAEKLIEFLK